MPKYGVEGLRFRVQGSGFRVRGIRVWGVRVWGLGFRIQGLAQRGIDFWVFCVCMRVCMHTYMYTHKHTHMHIHTYGRVRMYTHMHAGEVEEIHKGYFVHVHTHACRRGGGDPQGGPRPHEPAAVLLSPLPLSLALSN